MPQSISKTRLSSIIFFLHLLVAAVAFLDLGYLQLLSSTFGGRQSYFQGFRLSSNFEDIRLMSVRLIHRLRLSTNILSFINHSR